MNTSIEAAKLKVEIFKCLFQKDKYGNLPYADETANETNKVFNALVHEKKMSKVYISGPISHYDYSERKQTFLKMQQALEKKGHEVFNPMFNGLPVDAGTHEHMRVDFQMLLQCDTILMLPKWNHSAGCTQEFNVAVSIGCEVKFLLSMEPLIIVDTKFE